RELNTYHVMDSIGQNENLDQKLKWLSALTTGLLPLGHVDLRLDQVLNYNGYEGLRTGIGLVTNDRISRYFSLGGYGAYGFKDEQLKYGADLTLKPRPGRDLRIKGYYRNDVAESGGVEFPRQRIFTNDWYRQWFVDRMDRIERIGGEVSLRLNRSFKMRFGSERSDRWNLIGYEYADQLTENITFNRDRFVSGTIKAGLRFAFRERLVRLPDREVAIASRWPVLNVQAQRSIPGLWNGEQDNWRIDLMLDKTFRLRMIGDLSIHLLVGMADPDSPYPFLYNLRGTFDRRLAVVVENTFQVMRPNEFLADRYVSIHVRHSFGDLLYKGKKWRPIPVLIGNAAWGGLDRPEVHHGYSFTSLKKGYYEAGLEINNIIRTSTLGYGIGIFTRLGVHRSADPWNDLAVKLVMALR
ncbi:MAG: DUF5686 family protein, partial [Bacteroidota bacterium]|nr:DUF5686 family protein [Bacteroidota bacterium]